MPAYIIALQVIKDRDELNKYRALVHDVLDKYEGEAIISNETQQVLEGTWPYTKTVVIRFPSIQQATRWYNSKEYQDIIEYRHRAAVTDMIVIDGKA